MVERWGRGVTTMDMLHSGVGDAIVAVSLGDPTCTWGYDPSVRYIPILLYDVYRESIVCVPCTTRGRAGSGCSLPTVARCVMACTVALPSVRRGQVAERGRHCRLCPAAGPSARPIGSRSDKPDS